MAADDAPRQQLNPAALTVEELAQLLAAAGGTPVSADDVRADVAAGAPVLPGGRVNLVHYAAWLVREVQAT